MNNELLSNVLRFVVLVLAQVLIFNHIDFAGYINPYPYILFIALFPFDASKLTLLFSSFFLGLCVDVFSDGGGVNTIACLITAQIRPLFLRASFGIGIAYNSVKIQDVGMNKSITYLILLILTHHLVLYSLEIFSFTHIWVILKKTFYSGVFTLILSGIFMSIFNRKR